MEKIRTAILGFGRTASAMHAVAIEALDEFEVVAVCDISPDRREEASNRFGCNTYEDHLDMLRKEEIDLVCVLTRSDQHCSMTCNCLAAGANVVVTKPWATNAEEARRMIAAAKEADRLLLPWLPARWGCDLERLKELISENAIGKVFMVRRTVSSFATRSDWQTELRYGGGYLLNWGPHIIEPAYLVMRSPVSTVYGRLKRTINPGDAEDCFLAILTLEDGTVVLAEYTVSVEHPPDWFIEGDRGTISVRGSDLTLYQSKPQAPGDPTDFSSMEAAGAARIEERLEGALYGDEVQVYREIAHAILGRKEFPVSPQDALELSNVLDAIRLSDKENRVVTLD